MNWANYFSIRSAAVGIYRAHPSRNVVTSSVTGVTIAVADGMGWSREAVKDYAALQKINDEAWSVVTGVVTSVTTDVTGDSSASADENEKAVTSQFTEGLLRNILDLEPAQQLDLCKCLIPSPPPWVNHQNCD